MKPISQHAKQITDACPPKDADAVEYFASLNLISDPLVNIARSGIDKGHGIGFQVDMTGARVVKVFWIPKRVKGGA